MKKIILLITCSYLLTIAYTQPRQQVQHKQLQDIGLDTWTYNNNKIELTNQTDTTTIVHKGDLYFETTPKKYISVQSTSAKKFTILPEKTIRRINIINYTEDNTAIISVIKGKALINYNNKTYKVPQGYTMNISKEVKIWENKDLKSDTTWLTDNIYSAGLPIHITINKIARYYGYTTIFLREPKLNWITDSDLYTSNVIDELNSITGRKNENFKYKIKGKTITIY
jgi:hypothetical protein